MSCERTPGPPPPTLLPLAALGVLLGTDLAGAQRPEPPFDAPVIAFDETERALHTADLDADGDLDAVGWMLTATGSKVSAWFNDGSGWFDAAWSMTFVNTLAASGTGDFDGDGRADVALIFDDGTTMLLQSRATGQPVPMAAWTTTAAASRIITADLDGDGADDLIVAGHDPVSGTGFRIRLNRGTSFPIAASATGAAFDIDVVDLDRDGKTELLVTDARQCTIYDFDGASLSSTASWLHGVSASFGVYLAAVGDIDGDADLDIVVSDGAARSAVQRATGPTFVAEPVQNLVACEQLADLDGDGDLDAAACNPSFRMPLSGANLRRTPFLVSLNDGTGQFSTFWSIPALGSSGLAGLADLDGDGDPDLLAGRSVLLNQDGFRRVPQPFSGSPQTFSGNELDFDGDGDLDVRVPLGSRVQYLINDGAGWMRVLQPTRPPIPSLESSAWAGDFDGDGDDDQIAPQQDGGLFFQLVLLRNEGGGLLVDGGPAAAPGVSLLTAPPSRGLPGQVLTVDLDGDGDLDLVPDQATAFAGINDGSGFFSQGPATAFSDRPSAAADVDGDGWIDVLTLDHQLYWGSGAGIWDPSPTAIGTLGRDLIADADGDGDLDVCQATTGAVIVYENLGNRTFGTHTIPTRILRFLRLACTDVDQDGAPDILAGEENFAPDTTWVIRGKVGGGWHAPFLQAIPFQLVFDTDGDGDQDAWAGDRMVRGTTLDGGFRQQYGTATQGTGGAVPALGASGPFRVGEVTELRVTGALGGAPAALVFGTARAALPGTPLPGTQLLVAPPLVAVPLALAGAGAGAGKASLSWPVPPAASGAQVFLQCFIVDGARASGIGYTNGLELGFR